MHLASLISSICRISKHASGCLIRDVVSNVLIAKDELTLLALSFGRLLLSCLLERVRLSYRSPAFGLETLSSLESLKRRFPRLLREFNPFSLRALSLCLEGLLKTQHYLACVSLHFSNPLMFPLSSKQVEVGTRSILVFL